MWEDQVGIVARWWPVGASVYLDPVLCSLLAGRWPPLFSPERASKKEAFVLPGTSVFL